MEQVHPRQAPPWSRLLHLCHGAAAGGELVAAESAPESDGVVIAHGVVPTKNAAAAAAKSAP